jgi:TonB-dependent receptor
LGYKFLNNFFTSKEIKMRRAFTILSISLLVLVFFNRNLWAGNSNIEGYVRDAKTGEALFGANVMLLGTSMGSATDMNGKYLISNVPAGSYSLRITYIGYKTQTAEITIKENTNLKRDFRLEPVGVEGKTVVVTAQASGQSQAINQQLSSNQIINVVSAAKIQELPDANAAESVGRLPGISVLRNGGEGTEVVIRGLQPKYNQILIDGVQMSSSNPDDRSTDLSMISSNMLEGIQVSKTVTPDMDANVIGGTVNFELREAKVKAPGVPNFGLLVQGGYNGLSDAYNKFNNYKYIGSAEDRFLNERLGIFAQVDVERKNLTSNEMGATYTHAGNSISQYYTTALNLYDIPRDIQRYNGALVIDYKLPEGKVKLSNFISRGISNNQTRQETFDILNNQIIYGLTQNYSQSWIVTNGIDFQQQLPIFQMDLKVSNAYTESKDPNDWSINFSQQSAGLSKFNNVNNVNPINIPPSATYNYSKTILNTVYNNSSFSKENAVTGSLDLKTTINFSDLVNAEIKFGGMYRYQTRSYNYDQYDGGGFMYGGAGYANDLIISYFSLPPSVKFNIPITYFNDPNYNYGTFLNGDYNLVEPLNLGLLTQMVHLLRSNVQNIVANNGSQSFSHDNFLSNTNNYSGNENQAALYLMTVVNIGPELTIIPGVRYQNLETNYTGVRGIESRNAFLVYNHYDTTVTQSHGYWLPDVSLRYKPVSWFDVRLSYTNTLAYPDYDAIIPRIDIGNGTIAWNNYKLVPSKSRNYDAYFSFYNNTIGLFTVGTFLKQIDNLIYPWAFYVNGLNASQYFPASLLSTPSTTGTYLVNTFVNDSYQINNYGIELDWQTHFWYLPGPLSGLVFSANYTHIFSKAEYPYVNVISTGRSISYVDTSFIDRLLDQPNNIVNLSLGFDYHDFSIRVSMLYQADIFTGVNFWPQLRSYTSAYTRWDVSAKQELPWFGLQIYGDINNINGANDVSVIHGGGVPQSIQNYGMTADLGLRWGL